MITLKELYVPWVIDGDERNDRKIWDFSPITLSPTIRMIKMYAPHEIEIVRGHYPDFLRKTIRTINMPITSHEQLLRGSKRWGIP
jgi:hypothetical protein